MTGRKGDETKKNRGQEETFGVNEGFWKVKNREEKQGKRKEWEQERIKNQKKKTREPGDKQKKKKSNYHRLEPQQLPPFLLVATSSTARDKMRRT